MATNNIVEYTDKGLKITKPSDGEKHLVYIRPGDQIQLDFTDDIQYRLVDGDVLAVLPNGAQLVLLSLGTMSMTPDEASLPKLVDSNGITVDILNVAEISELTDQEKPISNRFLDFLPASEESAEVEERLSRQEERLENTLETINDYVSEIANNSIAGPQNNIDADGEQNSGTQSTVEFVQETVEKVITATESTTIPEPKDPSRLTQSAVPQEDSNPETQTDNPTPTVTFNIDSLDILGFAGGLDGDGVYQGAISNAKTINDPTASRTEAEDINLSSNDRGVTVYADHQFLVDADTASSSQTMAQIISINPNTPDNFYVNEILFSGLPNDAKVFAVVNGNEQVDIASIGSETAILKDVGNTSFTMQEGQDFTRGDPIQFLIQYPLDEFSEDDSTFTLIANATAVFDSEAESVTVPTVTTFTAEAEYTIGVKPLSDINISDGTDVLSKNPSGNAITTGTGDDIIFGGSGDDNINAGEGDDIIDGGLGNDTISGGGGVDSISYDNQAEGNYIKVNLEDGNVRGSVEILNQSGETVETDFIYGIENIKGTSGNDIINGNDLDNVLEGGAGNDTISGGLGNDTLDGGDLGIDSLNYNYVSSSDSLNGQGYHIDLEGGTSSLEDGSGLDIDEISGFETITGSVLADTIKGNEDSNTLDGGGGNDTISGGSAGTNLLIGGDNGDFQITLDTQTGETTIEGGDTISFQDRDTNLAASGVTIANLDSSNSGQTQFNSSSIGIHQGFENIIGSSLTDSITASDSLSNNNIVFASAGDDIINAGNNDSVEITVNGNEVNITGGDTFDMSLLDSSISDLTKIEVDLSDSNSAVITSESAIYTQTIQGFEHVIGTSQNDNITGNAGSNFISAGAGDDTISTGDGQDFVDAGEGYDEVTFADTTSSSGVDIDFDYINNRYLVTDNNAGSTENPTILINVEKILGSDVADQFTGSILTDTFDGGLGNDTFQATRGGDVYFGDEGENLISYADQQGIDNSDTDRFINANGRLAQLSTILNIDNGVGSVLGSDNNYIISNLLNTEITYQQNVDLTGLRVDMSDILAEDGVDFYQVQYAENTDNGGAVFRTDKISDIQHFIGTSGNDFVAGDSNNNSLNGGIGNDFIAGREGDDELEGGDGDDILVGGLGNDILDGGSGNDWASYQFSNDITINLLLNNAQNTVSDGNDVLTNIENIITGAGDDNIEGDANINQLIAGAGNDTINGNGGADTIDGGDGNDTIDFNTDAYDQGVRLTIDDSGSGLATYQDPSNTDITASISGIENIEGSSGNDTFTGNDTNNTINGDSGDDIISGGASGDDTLLGGEGDDTIYYNTRNGSVDGGDGTDILEMTDAQTAFSLDLNNSLNQAAGNLQDTTTITGFENITSNGGSQIIYATLNQQNTLNLGDGNDTVYGGSGDDDYNGEDGEDVISYGNGSYYITSGIRADFSVNGNITDDTGSTTLSTISGFEELIGTSQTDNITLGDSQVGLITVDVGGGADEITVDSSMYEIDDISIDGGEGNDTLIFNGSESLEANLSSIKIDDKTTNFSNTETVQGGSGTDSIILSNRITTNGSAITDVDNAKTVEFTNFEILNNSGDTSGSTYIGIDGGNFLTIMAGSGDDDFTIDSTDGSIDSETMEINAGNGEDRLTLGDFSTTITNSNGVTFDLQIESDIYNVQGFETIIGGDGADNWDFSSFSSDDMVIDAGAGGDSVTGSGANDIIRGGAGDDDLTGGTGHSTLFGGDGSDGYTINGEDTVSFEGLPALTIDYNDSGTTVVMDDGTGSGTNITENIFYTDSTVDQANIIASDNNDTLNITFGSSDTLNSFNAGEGSGNNDLDTVNISGSLDNVTIDSSTVGELSNVEVIDFTGMENLGASTTITLSTDSLADWAGLETDELDNGGGDSTINTSDKELQLNFSLSDIDSWSDIQFDLDGGSTDSNPNTFTGNELTVDGSGNITNSGAVTAGTYHVYFNDANVEGENLHLVVNISS